MKELYSIIIGLAIIFILFVGLCRINKDFRYFALENMGMLSDIQLTNVEFYRQVKTNNKIDLEKNNYTADFDDFTVDFDIILKEDRGTLIEFYNPLMKKKCNIYIGIKDKEKDSFSWCYRYNLKTKRITFDKYFFNISSFSYSMKNNSEQFRDICYNNL